MNTLTGEKVAFIKSILGIIPLSSVGFAWLIPAIIAFIIGTIAFRNKQEKISQAADF